MREQGIEANATPRRVRGVVKKAEKQAIRHINEEHAKGQRKAPAYVIVAQNKQAEQEAKGEGKHINPAQDKIVQQRKQVQHDYGVIARALAKSPNREDKKLALSIVDYVRKMLPLTTRHQEHVTKLKAQMEKQEKTVYISGEKQR